jgi:hypothetical protein
MTTQVPCVAQKLTRSLSFSPELAAGCDHKATHTGMRACCTSFTCTSNVAAVGRSVSSCIDLEPGSLLLHRCTLTLWSVRRLFSRGRWVMRTTSTRCRVAALLGPPASAPYMAARRSYPRSPLLPPSQPLSSPPTPATRSRHL